MHASTREVERENSWKGGEGSREAKFLYIRWRGTRMIALYFRYYDL